MKRRTAIEEGYKHSNDTKWEVVAFLGYLLFMLGILALVVLSGGK